MSDLIPDRDIIIALCHRFHVARLEMFGSAVTERFDSDRSDIDFLVEFRPDVPDAFAAYFGLKEALEEATGRPVDLVSPKALRNPHFAARTEKTRHELYAA